MPNQFNQNGGESCDCPITDKHSPEYGALRGSSSFVAESADWAVYASWQDRKLREPMKTAYIDSGTAWHSADSGRIRHLETGQFRQPYQTGLSDIKQYR